MSCCIFCVVSSPQHQPSLILSNFHKTNINVFTTPFNKNFHVRCPLREDATFFSLSLSPISFIWCSAVLELEHTENIQPSMCLFIRDYSAVSFQTESQPSHSLLQKTFCAFDHPCCPSPNLSSSITLFLNTEIKPSHIIQRQANHTFINNVMFCSVFLSL